MSPSMMFFWGFLMTSHIFLMDNVIMMVTGRWAKGRFKEAGLGDTPLWKISGGLPVEWKSTVMERFRTRYVRGWYFPHDGRAN